MNPLSVPFGVIAPDDHYSRAREKDRSRDGGGDRNRYLEGEKSGNVNPLTL